MRIDGNGNVGIGIGTASPIGTLNVQGRVNVGGTALFNSTAVLSQVVGASSSYYGAWKTAATSGGSVFGCGTNPFEIYAASGTLGSDTYLLRAYVDTSGNFLLNPLTASAVFNASGTTQGIKLPSSPGNIDGQTLDCYAESTYTATDNSGAGLVYTVNNAAVVTRVGRLVFVRLDITFPVTVSTAYANIAVPFTSIVNGGTGTSVAGAIGTCLVLANAASLEVYASAPITRQTNANLSGVRLVFSITYQAA
jgi:hypothetical protein